MQTNVNGLAKLPSHQLAMTLLMTPDMANFMGNVHGGSILKLLDQVAYACASRYAGCYVVTLSVDQVTFREPIHVGELVTFLASSQLHRQHVAGGRHQGDRRRYSDPWARHVNRCYFTMVAVNEAGKPTAVPPLTPSTPNERRRFEEANLRKALRRELAVRHKAMKHPRV